MDMDGDPRRNRAEQHGDPNFEWRLEMLSSKERGLGGWAAGETGLGEVMSCRAGDRRCLAGLHVRVERERGGGALEVNGRPPTRNFRNRKDVC